MMVESLSDESQAALIDFARDRLPASFFVLYDILEDPGNTETLIAVERGHTQGVCLRYRKRSLVMLGSRRAANSLAAELSDLGEASIICDPEWLPALRRWFRLSGAPRRMLNMATEEGQAVLSSDT